MAGLSSAAPTQCDRHGFFAIAWEEMRPQLCMLCFRKPQYNFHMSRSPELALEPVLNQLEVAGEVVLASAPWIVGCAVA